MAPSDLFKRTVDAGTSFLDLTRERAEVVVKEWVDAGDVGKAKAQKAIDDLMLRSRKMSEELREIIRREIREQVSTLGFATQDDVARLESRLEPTAASSRTPATGVRSQPAKSAPIKKAGATVKKTAPRAAAPVKKTGPVKKMAPLKKAATAKKVTSRAAAPAKKAGSRAVPVTKASPQKRSSASAAVRPGKAGPAGEVGKA